MSTGGLRYTFVPGIKAGQHYGYLVQDQAEERVVQDPYAQALSETPFYVPPFTAKQSWEFAKSVVTAHQFDWQQTSHPKVPYEETVLFETHVRGFTKLNPDIDEQYRGTYLGLCQPEVIQYFKRQGITSLQLLPVTSCMSEPHLLKMG